MTNKNHIKWLAAGLIGFALGWMTNSYAGGRFVVLSPTPTYESKYLPDW